MVINPKDYAVNVLANAVRIYNEFKKLGFDTREKFVNICLPELGSYEAFKECSLLDSVKLLQNWWQIRIRDERLNNALDNMLEQLKDE